MAALDSHCSRIILKLFNESWYRVRAALQARQFCRDCGLLSVNIFSRDFLHTRKNSYLSDNDQPVNNFTIARTNLSQVGGELVKLLYRLRADLISGDIRSTKYVGFNSTSKYSNGLGRRHK